MGRIERALVTGGAGFLGSHLCEYLVRQGTDVVCVDNFRTAATGARATETPRWSIVEADITEPLEISGDFDYVFHLACPASPQDYLRLPIETLKTGGLGTLTALDFAEGQGARFVLASTSEIYGDPQEHPQRETYWGNVNPVGLRSVYDEAKRYSEALTIACRRARHTNTAIARIFNTYGPRMRPDDGRMIPSFITQALAGEPITITGDGQQTRSLCYVDDTVRGLVALAHSDVSGPLNVGNPHEVTVNEIAEKVRWLSDSTSPITYIAAIADDPRRRCPDISQARAVLNWHPTVGLDEGLLRTIEWFAGLTPRATPVGASLAG